MRERIDCIVAAMFLIAFLAGCAGSEHEPKGMDAKGKQSFPLTLNLTAEPKEVVVHQMPGTDDPNKPQARSITFTLTVTNDRRSDYEGEWPDSGVVRFWVTDSLSVIWASDEMVLPTVTKIHLKPGERAEPPYRAKWEIKNARALLGKKLTAHAIFLPEHLTTKAEVPIKVVSK